MREREGVVHLGSHSSVKVTARLARGLGRWRSPSPSTQLQGTRIASTFGLDILDPIDVKGDVVVLRNFSRRDAWDVR